MGVRHQEEAEQHEEEEEDEDPTAGFLYEAFWDVTK